MLKHRLISAAVGLAIIIPAILYSTWAVGALVAFAIVVALKEYMEMMLQGASKDLLFYGLAISAGFGLLLFLPNINFKVLVFGSLVACFAGVMFLEKDLAKAPKELALILTGMFYIPFCFSHVYLLHHLPNGPHWVLWLLTATFMGDTGAYMTGRMIGRHKLIPHVSPGKTWEGFAGQIVFALGGSFFYHAVFMRDFSSPKDALWIGLFCGLLGPLGDLCESMLKRAVGVKDSGKIMPGHGGILDRIDGVLFTAPAVFFYVDTTRGLFGGGL